MEKKAPLEERMARIEGIMEEIRNHLNHLEHNYRMLLWVQIGSWVTLMAAIIGVIATIIAVVL